MSETIVVSSDHAGWELKNHVKPFLEQLGFQVEDVGTYSAESVDYPAFTLKAVVKVASGECRRAIVFCGTGQGDAMVANKVPGIRAALCWDVSTARLSRAHNDANVLVLGGWFIGYRLAEEIISAWLEAPFDGGRHERRLAEVAAIEKDLLTKRRCTYDISSTIVSGMTVWPGDEEVVIDRCEHEGNTRLSTITMSAHAGSHVDSPVHLFPGAPGIDCLGLDVLVGLARVCQLGDVKTIDNSVLGGIDLQGVTRLLLGTKNSAQQGQDGFRRDYVSMTPDAAQYLVERGIVLVAIDGLSVDCYDTEDYPVHRVLLSAGVAVVEGVNLTGVPAGDYELICLPLKIAGGDGAPARVILREL